jgi:tRNA A-37 threonylcarbamoyl transferase component Bud32
VTLDASRALEAAGQLEAAYKGYVAEGHIDDAARMLAAHGRALEAADLLLSAVARLSRPLDSAGAGRTLAAARFLEDNDKPQRALQVLAWLGDANALNACAERVAAAGLVFDAGCAMARHGDPAKATTTLLRVPRTDDQYGTACVEATRALARGAPLTMQLDRWLAGFIRTGPDTDDGADAFYALAALYARQDMPENALEVLTRLVDKRPNHKDAMAWRKRLEQQILGTNDALAKVLDEDAAFEAAVRGVRLSDKLDNREPLVLHTPAAVPLGVLASAQTPVVLSDSPTQIIDEVEQATTLSFAPGATVAKRYKIVDVLGKGGMSIVYEALDLELSETVALKLFTQPTNEEAIERFKQEIRLARQLIHDNIIRVYDLGTALGARFLTMELLVGEDLHAKMTRGISLRDGCRLLAQACDGLHLAHKLGVVHRDIKPENLFVTRDNTLKVMDFGIAKQTRQPGLTIAGMVVGTPEYMAPEQAHGHMQITHAADLYSVGIILYALATGQLPFRHDELVPLLLMHVSEPPIPPRRLNPGCPVEVEALILELLAKRAEDRPASAAVVAERLRGFQTAGIV